MTVAEDWKSIVRPGVPETYGIPGAAVAVADLDGGRWTAGYGTAGPGDVFQACSISKHVTAFGTLRMVAAGLLDLDTDVHRYLTSAEIPGRPGITVRHLLAHTAGLNYFWFRGYGHGDPLPTLAQTLRGEPPANTPPVRSELTPGTTYRYSGAHYAVLQQVMEDVSGKQFGELMQTLVLDPLGMADSSFDQGFPDRRDDVAHGHHITGTPVPGGWRIQPELAGAGLWSTPADLTRLELEILRALDGRSALLPPELATRMRTPQVPDGFGLGTEIGDGFFGHNGHNVGYNCFSYAWPDAGTAVAVMANSDDCKDLLLALITAFDRRLTVN